MSWEIDAFLNTAWTVEETEWQWKVGVTAPT